MELELQNVVKKYNNRTVINNISLKLDKGIYGLLGPNGAGKSTLVRMLCGIEEPDSGNILLNGMDNKKAVSVSDIEYRKVLGYVPQDVGYYPDFTAEKFLLYMAKVKGLNSDNAKKRTGEVLRIVGLNDTGKKKIRKFSGGMKRRLGIAQSILNKPEVLILDEPTAGLDLKERMNFKQFISEYAADKIIIFATHIVSDIEDIGNEIIILKEGSVQLAGKPEKLLQSVKDKVWEAVCTKEEAEKLKSIHKISNIKLNGGEAKLRIVSDKKPMPRAVLRDAGLQDLYLYLFGDVAEG